MIEPVQVSCVIPYAGAQTYASAQEYFIEAVNSALMQGFGEVVIAYDGSEPLSLAGLPPKKIPRVIRLSQRVGAALARNAGIRACATPYIVLLDQDDVLCPDYLPAMLAWVTQNQLRCAAATLRYIGHSSKRVGLIVSRHPDFFLPSGFFSEAALVAEVGYFPDSISEDLLFFKKIQTITKLSTCPTAHTLYRIHPAASAGNMMAAWALIQLLPDYYRGACSLATINSLAKAYAAQGKIPPGMEGRFPNHNPTAVRFLARNTYACWLNRDWTGLIKYGGKLAFHVPELFRMARYKWGRGVR